MVGKGTSRRVEGLSVDEGGAARVTRVLPVEVPVAITCNGSTQAVMMASPSDLSEFAFGFALTEGYVTTLAQIERCEVVAHPRGIEAQLWLVQEQAEALGARRRFMAGPVGCGLCGIDSLEEAIRPLPRVMSSAHFSRNDIADASKALRARQPLHDETRSVHAAGFLSPDEGIVLVREDVGRHNALDKLIGALAMGGIDPSTGAFVMTSRLSVELVQKCAMAGCSVIVAVSAPTALAIDLAQEAHITVAAFARDGSFDLFTHPDRIEKGARNGA